MCINGAIVDSEVAGYEDLSLLKSGCRYLPKSHDCPNQTRLNDFEFREDRSSMLFVLASGCEPISLLRCPVSHAYVHYPMAEKQKLAVLLRT